MKRLVDALDCCATPDIVSTRVLRDSSKLGMWIELCRCGARWFHAWDEITMSFESDYDVETDSYARLSSDEDRALPAEPTDEALAALPERRILVRTADWDPEWKTGRVGQLR